MASSGAVPQRHGFVAKLLELLDTSLSSRYMQANLVYLLYTSIILYINLQLDPKADEAYADDVCVVFHRPLILFHAAPAPATPPSPLSLYPPSPSSFPL